MAINNQRTASSGAARAARCQCAGRSLTGRLAPCRFFVTWMIATGWLAVALPAAEPGIEFFETKIRPVVVEHCYSCHSAEAAKSKKIKAGLFLDSANGVRKGGDSGAVVVAGDPEKSLLMHALRGEKDASTMPPKGKLPNAIVEDFATWIKMGAPDPRGGESASGPLKPLELLPPDRLIGEVIDHYLDARLAQAKVKPAPPAPDATIVRRLHLDLVGRVPTVVEARVAARQTLDRSQLIASLVASPGFAKHNANEFDVLLRNNNSDAPSLRPYLLMAFQENRPWDGMFRDLLGASGTADATKPEAFVSKRLRNADTLTADVSSVFFGLNLTCAQCHQHPEIKKLTQDYFFGMKAFFATSYEFQNNLLERQYVKLGDFKDKKGESRKVSMMFLSGAQVEMETLPEKELTAAIAAEGKLIGEKNRDFAKTKELPPQPKFRARQQLAELALIEANRDRFARSIVNRLWFRFYGHGLVMRIDQMHDENDATHTELLQWLTRDLITHNYDLKRLITGLVSSRAYARSGEWQGKAPPREFFAVAPTRPLTPAQWSLSYEIVRERASFKEDDPADIRQKKLDVAESKPANFKFIEQPLEDFQIGIDEPLKLSNEDAVLKVISVKLVPEFRKLTEARQQIDEIFWTVLSRSASPEEVKLLSEYLDERKERLDDGLKQVIWALLNSPEFRFNH